MSVCSKMLLNRNSSRTLPCLVHYSVLSNIKERKGFAEKPRAVFLFVESSPPTRVKSCLRLTPSLRPTRDQI